MSSYGVREFRQIFDVTARTLRFYEDKGLITPIRQGVTRIYSEKDKVRLALTLRGKRLGFSLQEIKEIIDMYDPESPEDPAQLLALCQKIQFYRSKLINKFNDITDTLNFMDEVEGQALENLSAAHALNEARR